MRIATPWMIAIAGLAGCSQPSAEREPKVYWESLPFVEQATVSSLAQRGEGPLLAGTEAGLFISDDSGESWHLRGAADWHVSAVLSTSGGAWLLGTYRGGVKRSLDSGESWVTVGFENNVYVDALIEDRDGELFAAVAYSVNGEPTGIFNSHDDGETWTQTGLADENAFSVSAPLPGHLYAGTESGTYRSIDGGTTWSLVESLSFQAPLSQVMAHGGSLFASFAEPRYRATGHGVLRSSDDGRVWSPMEGLPPETSVHALAVMGDTVLAAAGDVRGRGGMGLFRSVDHRTWEPLSLQDQWLRSMATKEGGSLYVGAVEAGVFASGTGPTDWRVVNAGLRNWNPTAVAFDRAGRLHGLSLRSLFRYDETGKVWAAVGLPERTAEPTPMNFTNLSDGTLLVSGNGGILTTKDASTAWSWSAFPVTHGSALDIHVADDDRIFATLPTGTTWVADSLEKPWSPVAVPERTRGVFVSPAGTLIAFGRGMHRSEADTGWVKVGPEEQTVFGIASCGGALYSGGLPLGVFSSRDDGETWEPVTEELRKTAQQSGYLAVHSVLCLSHAELLAATFSDGVVKRLEDGTWVDVTAGLPSRSVGDLVQGPDGRVYVATTRGVYRGL